MILHGLFGSSRNWKGLSRQFAAHFQVITADLRNHGDSFHDATMDYPSMADDIHLLMDHLNLPSAHVLGHSMGGKVAMKFCQLHPDRVNKLVIADIAPMPYSHHHDDLIKPILALDLAHVSNRKEVDALLTSSIPGQQLRFFLLQNLTFRHGLASWKINWEAIRSNMTELTGYENIADWSIDNPSLFIRGTLSDYVKQEYWELISQHFHQATLVDLANAGHWLHAEQPTDFYAEVMRFLRG